MGTFKRAGAGSLQGQNVQGGIPFILASFLRREQECPVTTRGEGPTDPHSPRPLSQGRNLGPEGGRCWRLIQVDWAAGCDLTLKE